jgi:hypothetical protein
MLQMCTSEAVRMEPELCGIATPCFPRPETVVEQCRVYICCAIVQQQFHRSRHFNCVTLNKC